MLEQRVGVVCDYSSPHVYPGEVSNLVRQIADLDMAILRIAQINLGEVKNDKNNCDKMDDLPEWSFLSGGGISQPEAPFQW